MSEPIFQNYFWRAFYRDEGKQPICQAGSSLEGEEQRDQAKLWEDVRADRIRRFELVGEIDKRVIAVDLDDGHFEIDGLIIHPGRGDVEKLSGRKDFRYKLIFTERFFVTPSSSNSIYLLGWQVVIPRKEKINSILYLDRSGEMIFSTETILPKD